MVLLSYFVLYPKGSKIARLYVTSKINKSFFSDSIPPFRSIVSSIDTYYYKLTQYLGSLPSPHIPSHNATKDSFTFIKKSNSSTHMVNFWYLLMSPVYLQIFP